jgi:hypothetical protein
VQTATARFIGPESVPTNRSARSRSAVNRAERHLQHARTKRCDDLVGPIGAVGVDNDDFVGPQHAFGRGFELLRFV